MDWMRVDNALEISVSGLRAAATRVAVSAHNVANVDTDAYQPQRVVVAALAEGGVRAQVDVGGDGETVASRDDNADAHDDLPTELSSTDLIDETVARSSAAAAFRANLSVLRSVSEMNDALLRIKA